MSGRFDRNTHYEHLIEGPPQTLGKSDYIDYYNQGVDKYKAHQYSQAISLYTKALALHPPKTAEILCARGKAFSQMSDHDAALKDYTQSIQEQPRAEVYLARAILYDQELLIKRAESDTKQALLLEPNYEPALETLGHIHEEQGNLTDAVQDYTKSIALNPMSEYSYRQRGRCYKILGKEKEAISDIKNVLRINPKSYLAYWDIADLSEKAEQWQAAIEAYRQFLEYAPAVTKEDKEASEMARRKIKMLQMKNR
jgi:tetratricopeptide (TPR) repeat protein